MSNELMAALEVLGKEKQIDTEELLESLKHSLASAYKKYYDAGEEIEIIIADNGDIKVSTTKTVVDEVEDSANEISLDEAKKISKKVKVGETVKIEKMPKDFGRIAAQNAKQMLVQHIREAERSKLFNEYKEKESTIVTATVQKAERRGVLLSIGSTETIMPTHEQIPGENYRPGERIIVYILEVRNTPKGVQILVSRTHPELVSKLFAREVPEIADGTIEIKSIAREAGSRTKLAVATLNDNVDAVGACVGQKGVRVNAVLDDLKGEKVDIVKYSDNITEYITESLSPAKVMSATVNEEEKSAEVIVPEFQLSLAIGKEGQNVRLAAKLTGWKIDIKSDRQAGMTFGQ